MLLVIGVVLLGLNLRLAVTSVPPLLSEIGVKLGYSPAVQTVLTTVPVACFGAGALLARRLGSRLGDERALWLGVVALAAGTAAREVAPAAFFPGTVLAALGIAVLNVLLSSLVKRRAPQQAAPLLAAYLAALYVGAFAGSETAVPLYRAGGGSLRLALGIWALPALVAVVAWAPQLRWRTVESAPTSVAGLHRNRLAWAVTGFMGMQSLTFYASVSFLPQLYTSRGLDASTAGLVDGMLSVGGVVSAVAAPMLVARWGHARGILMASVGVGVVATAGTLWAPVGAAVALATALGLAQGVQIALALYFVMARAGDPAVAGSLSGMAQGFGYALATVGPLTIGLLHSATGRWGPSIVVLVALTALTIVPALAASVPSVIGSDGRTRRRG